MAWLGKDDKRREAVSGVVLSMPSFVDSVAACLVCLNGSQVLRNICAEEWFSHDRRFHEAVFTAMYEEMKCSSYKDLLGSIQSALSNFEVATSLKTCAV